MFAITPSALSTLNPTFDAIQADVPPGSEICVRDADTAPVDCTVYEPITSNTTCAKVLRSYQLEPWQLDVLNPGLDCRRVAARTGTTGTRTA
jgi:hypothetical protein